MITEDPVTHQQTATKFWDLVDKGDILPIPLKAFGGLDKTAEALQTAEIC